MIKINNVQNPNSVAPRVTHFIIDESLVPAPIVNYSDTLAYFPFYSQKGRENELIVYRGSTAYKKLLEDHGEPNTTKYGLPYSGAVLHASLGGGVIAQCIKAPNATHAAFMVRMVVEPAQTKQLLGWVFEDTDNTLVDVTTDPSGRKYFELKSEHLLLNGNKIKIHNQFMPASINNIDKSISGVGNPLNPVQFFGKSIKEQFPSSETESTQAWETFINAWKPIEVDAITIRFESVDFNKLMKNADLKNKFNGVTSANTLNAIAQYLANKPGFNLKENKNVNVSFAEVMSKIKSGDKSWSYGLPILWGYNTGKGVEGNNYLLSIKDTNGDVSGRPIMEAQLLNTFTKTEVPNSKRKVSFSNDYYLGTPLLFESAYGARSSFTQPFKFFTANLRTFDDLGEIIEAFLLKNLTIDGQLGFRKDSTNFFDPMFTSTTGDKTYGPEGDKFLKDIKDTLDLLGEPEDSGLHRLSYLDINELTNKPGFVLSGGLTDYAFNGGHEGEFRYMKEFNWDFNFKDLANRYPAEDEDFQYYLKIHGDKKLLQEVFIEAFTGKRNKGVITFSANPCDYIIDMDYPYAVKQAMLSLVDEKDDVLFITNTPTTAVTPDENLAFKAAMNRESRNIWWHGANHEWVDQFTNRGYRIPNSFALIPNMIQHFKNGYTQPIAGITRGKLSIIEPGSTRAVGDMYDDNEKLYKNGISIFSMHLDGEIYMDSQMTNYQLDQRSSLQEVHNNTIINRMIKDVYVLLQQFKHELLSDASIERINSIVNRELSTRYSNKVRSFSYKAEIAGENDRALGFITHRIDCEFINSIKSQHVIIKALKVSK